MLETVRPTNTLQDVLVIEPRRFTDDRGFFEESWNLKSLEEAGVVLPAFVQDNHSFSTHAGTVRGLHFQAPPCAQGKLVRCGRGRIFDVAVDIRQGSPTYGSWCGEELTFANGRQLWIPPGFLHGFMTLEDESEAIYKCTEFYSGEYDRAVRWDSAGIDWPSDDEAILSEKDASAPPFSEFESPFLFETSP